MSLRILSQRHVDLYHTILFSTISCPSVYYHMAGQFTSNPRGYVIAHLSYELKYSMNLLLISFIFLLLS